MNYKSILKQNRFSLLLIAFAFPVSTITPFVLSHTVRTFKYITGFGFYYCLSHGGIRGSLGYRDFPGDIRTYLLLLYCKKSPYSPCFQGRCQAG